MAISLILLGVCIELGIIGNIIIAILTYKIINRYIK